MKILRIIATVDPRTGGPIEGLFQSSAALKRLGHETEIATLDRPTDPWVSEAQFPVHALGPRMRVYGYSSRFSPWLRANRAKYNGAIIHGIWNYSSVGAWRALAGGPTPYAIFTHGSLDPWHRQAYPIKDLAKQAFWLALEGRVLRDAKCVLFTTEEERRLARAAYWGRQSFQDRVVAYGTGDVSGDPVRQISEFRRSTGISEDRRFLLFLSRIHPKKGVDLLIKAFATIAAGQPDLDLVVAGPDQVGWTEELTTLANKLGIGDRVLWPGMLRGEVKWGAYRAADAFVLPSHGENFGIVVAEAMACGTPVVISDRVNIWREVQAAGAGLICQDNEASVSASLRQLAGLTTETRAKMGAAAREAYLRHFEVTAAARDLLSVFDSNELENAA